MTEGRVRSCDRALRESGLCGAAKSPQEPCGCGWSPASGSFPPARDCGHPEHPKQAHPVSAPARTPSSEDSA